LNANDPFQFVLPKMWRHLPDSLARLFCECVRLAVEYSTSGDPIPFRLTRTALNYDMTGLLRRCINEKKQKPLRDFYQLAIKEGR